MVDDDFDVMLDRTCFGHAVGEVELIAGRAGTGADYDVGDGHQRIDDFMRKYAWFFGGGEGGKKVEGKFSAYFERFGEGGKGGMEWLIFYHERRLSKNLGGMTFKTKPTLQRIF